MCDIIEGGMIKRRVMGREHGLAVVAEGIGEKLDNEELAGIPAAKWRTIPTATSAWAISRWPP